MKNLTLSLLTLILFPFFTFGQVPVQPTGAGTSGDPYLVASKENILWINQNSSSWSSHFKQTVDIDATGTSSWNSGAGLFQIGNSTTAFVGVYNGDDYTISNLSHDNANLGDYAGLFGNTNWATITNLGLLNITLTGVTFTGALVGFNNVTYVSNCYATGSITGGSNVGGLMGYTGSSLIDSSYADVSVSASWGYTGGLIGKGANGSINKCYALGSVYSGNTHAGGFIGENYNYTINDCYARGNISGNNGGGSYAGGFIGYLNTATITNTYSTGSVTNFPTTGGLIGYKETSSVVNSFWDTQASSQPSSDGGTGKLTAEMKTQSTFTNAGWDFSTPVWGLSSNVNNGYLILDAFFTSIPASGAGTQADPYQIASTKNILWIIENTTTWDKHFKQTTNIDATGTSSWNSGKGLFQLGNGTPAFTGVYDGDEYTISNLSHDVTSLGDYAGFFGYTFNATIKNIGLVNTTITGNEYVGILVGSAYDNDITNCSSTGSVIGHETVGGLVGYAWSGSITKCHSSNSISISGNKGGGLLGAASNSTISNCFTHTNLSATGDTTSNFGGLVGYCSGNIDNSYSHGNLSTIGTFNYGAAGLVGNLSDSINNSYSTCEISGFTYSGGLVAENKGAVTNSFWDTETSGQSTSDGGSGKTTAEMKTKSTFVNAGWDFSTPVWGHSSIVNDGYPILDAFFTSIPASGAGTQSDPYLIASTKNILWIIENTTTWDKHFKQTANIDATGTSSWNSGKGLFQIGNSTTAFTGVYDGDDYTISNLSHDNASLGDYAGFFGNANGATIQGLGLLSITLTAGNFSGALVGNNIGTYISNCFATGIVTGGSTVGGLIGYTGSSLIDSSYTDVSVSASWGYTGGLIGGGANGSISKCHALGSVYSAYLHAGGFMGENFNYAITDCYARGNVSGTNGGGSNAGGLIGYLNTATITNTYSTGSVNNFPTTGGLIGYQQSSSVNNSFWDTQTSSQALSAGGTGKSTAEMKTQSTFTNAGWDFNTPVWELTSNVNNGYPYLDATSITSILPLGTGTISDPYLIANKENILWIIEDSASWSKHFLQTANIDASETSYWNRGKGLFLIGNSTTAFAGVYNGDDYTISNLSHDNVSLGDTVGFFGNTNGATITNLGLINVTITAGNSSGALVGNNNVTYVSNCYATGSVTGGSNVGGLMGYTGSSLIDSSYADVSVSANGGAGGFIGKGANGTISKCYALGSVYSGNTHAGGFMGENYNYTITDCYAWGNISGNNSGGSYAGGFIGYLNTATITNTYSTGSVINFPTTGGLIGYNASSSVINSFWDTITSGQTGSSGGIGESTAKMKTQSTFTNAGWDFSTIWWISDMNNGYPYLEAFSISILPPGIGTISDPYLIANKENILWLVENSASWGSNFRQTADIDATGSSSWNSGKGLFQIGNSTTAFTGIYDGDDYTISNLSHDNASLGDYAGFFGYTNNAIIKNIGLVTTTIAGNEYVGILVGSANNNDITNCFSNGSVSGIGEVGGLVGQADGCNITLCHSSNSISIRYGSACGGLIGMVVYSTITKCFANTSLTVTATNSYFGGLVGGFSGGYIGNSYARGNLSTIDPSNESWTAGLIGYSTNVLGPTFIYYSYSTCEINGFTDAGGLIAENISSTVTNSFWDTETSGQSTSAGGTGKTTAEMKTQSTFTNAGWDFSNIWAMDTTTNEGYAYLQNTSSIIVWDGSTNTDWNTATNWSGDIIPSSVNSVIVPIANNYPVINQDPGSPAECKNLTLQNGASLIINTGKALNVNGILNVGNSASVTLNSNATLNIQ